MPSITLTAEQVDAIFDEDEAPGLEYEIIEEGDWVHNSPKVECSDWIVKINGKFYMLSFGRQGSHWTDWYYGFRESGNKSFEWTEVTKVEVVTYEWKVIK